MNIRNCKSCGNIYHYDGFSTCPKCRRDLEADYKVVKDYLHQHPGADITEVHQETEVGVDRIIEFLKDGRLEIVGRGNLVLECEVCGVSINTGRFCNACKADMARDFQGAVGADKAEKEEDRKIKDTNARFRYVNKRNE